MTLGMVSSWCDHGTIKHYLREVDPEADRVNLVSHSPPYTVHTYLRTPTIHTVTSSRIRSIISTRLQTNRDSRRPQGGKYEKPFPSSSFGKQMRVSKRFVQGNILVDKNGHAKITDFGVSKVIEDFSDVLKLPNPTSSFAGSTRWLAPELVWALVEDVSPRITTYSDVYAFGAVAMEVQFPLCIREKGDRVVLIVYVLRF